MRDALASFREYLVGAVSESGTKDTLIDLTDDFLNSSDMKALVEPQLTDTATHIYSVPSSISSSQFSILSSYGMGIGLALAGSFLATKKNKSKAARTIARIFGTDVDRINKSIVLEKLRDKRFFSSLQDAVLNVITTNSIDKFADELQLTKDEAWEVYFQIKDLLLDGEILGIILSTSFQLTKLRNQIDSEFNALKNKFSDTLDSESQRIENNFQRLLINSTLSDAGLRLLNNLTSFREPNRNCWKDAYFTEADIKEGYDARRPITDELLESVENNRGTLVDGRAHYGKSTLLKRIIIEEIERGYTILFVERPGINSQLFADLIVRIHEWSEVSHLVVICEDVYLKGGEQTFKVFNDLNRQDLKNIKFIFSLREDEFRKQRESMNTSDIAEVDIALRNIPIIRLGFTLNDATIFLEKALVTSILNETDIPSRDEISRVARILYELSKTDPLAFTCLLMAYLQDKRTLEREGYINYLERDLNDKKRILNENPTLWRPAIYCSIMGALGIKLMLQALERCDIYSNELIALKNKGLLVKNAEFKIRHEIWAIEFLTYVYVLDFDSNFRGFNNQFGVDRLLKAISDDMNKSELIIMLDRCSLLLERREYEKIARLIIESFRIPEGMPESDIADLYCFGLAKFYSSLRDYDKALEYFDKALSINGSHIPSLLNKASVYMDIQKPREARTLYDKILRLDSRSVEALYNKGNAFLEINDPLVAMDCFDKALEIEPNYSFTWMNRGIAFHQSGFDHGEYEALHCYNKALDLDPRNDRAWLNKANTLFDSSPFEALNCYNKALELNDKEPLAWYNKGKLCHEKLEDYDEASNCYDKALEIKPSLDVAKVGKLNLLIAQGKYEEALEMANREIEHSQNRAIFLIGKCRLLMVLLNIIRNHDAHQQSTI
jgi:tetratricopeptide (TPR) repeat protein